MYISSDESQDESKDGKEGSDKNSESSSNQQRKREAKAIEKFEKKLYKPTGPDGKGWGEFRDVNKEEKIILEELERIEIRN